MISKEDEPKKEKYFKQLQEINKDFPSHQFDSMLNNFNKTLSTLNQNNFEVPAENDFLESSLTEILGTNKTTHRGQVTQTLNNKNMKTIEDSFASTGFEIMVPLKNNLQTTIVNLSQRRSTRIK